jgi:glutamate 5-kinase
VGTGGAATKVSAARVATASGVGVLVTSADLVDRALRGDDIGTWFDPHPAPVFLPVTGPIRRPGGASAVDTLGR